MHLPEPTQQCQRCLRQRHQPVFIALGIAHMHTQTLCIDIAHLETQALAESQSQAIEGKKENFVTERVGCQEQTLGFRGGDDVRQALGFRRLDQIKM